MTSWLEASPALQRLAFGSVFMQLVTDQPTGYRRLAAYLPRIELDPENSSDFSYTINRPKPSTTRISDLVINRLSKWTVLQLRTVEVHISTVEGVSPETIVPPGDLFACRLEVDVSTSAQYQGELPHDRLPSLYAELVSLSDEIAAEGDIS